MYRFSCKTNKNNRFRCFYIQMDVFLWLKHPNRYKLQWKLYEYSRLKDGGWQTHLS